MVGVLIKADIFADLLRPRFKRAFGWHEVHLLDLRNEIARVACTHAKELLPSLDVGFRNVKRGIVSRRGILWDAFELVYDIDEVVCVEVVVPAYLSARHDVDKMSERMDKILWYAVLNASEW